MLLKSLKIPFGFLVTGILWALFSDPIISILAKGLNHGTRDLIRSLNDFVFVSLISVNLYFQIKKQQHRLISSENQYKRLFELNPNPMWIYKIGTLEFVRVNKAAIELYGYSMSEFLTMTIMDIRTENDHVKLIEYIEAAGQEVRDAGTWQHFKKNGESLYMSIVSYSIDLNNVPCSLVMANNITDIIINDKKIKAQNNMLQEIAWSNSHEVRRSLCSVISLVDLLAEAGDENERNEYIKLLQKCTTEFDVLLKKTNKKVEALKDN
ncbi:MAG: sensor protein [Mucilaginibacter sp.]|nr:sensor protein [Mucilaginibacter sp.]